MSQQDAEIPQTYIVPSKIPTLVCIYINVLQTVLQLPQTSTSQSNHFRVPHNSSPWAKMSRATLPEISKMSSVCCRVKGVNNHQKVEFLVGISVIKDTV